MSGCFDDLSAIDSFSIIAKGLSSIDKHGFRFSRNSFIVYLFTACIVKQRIRSDRFSIVRSNCPLCTEKIKFRKF